MKLQGENIFGLPINEYILTINPHQDLSNKIIDEKKLFGETYKNTEAIYGKPHIKIVNFLQYSLMEPHIINRLKAISNTLQQIKIEFNNFGSLPSHTIYLNITSKIPLQNLVKHIRQNTQKLMKLNKDNKPHFIIEPNITLARKLLPWQYEQAWTAYQQKNFRATCIATEMVLLKRELSDTKYKTAARFQFMGLPKEAHQGELF